MAIYKVTLIEKVKVSYQVDASSEEEAISKARIGNASFCDSILLGEPDNTFEIETLEKE